MIKRNVKIHRNVCMRETSPLSLVGNAVSAFPIFNNVLQTRFRLCVEELITSEKLLAKAGTRRETVKFFLEREVSARNLISRIKLKSYSQLKREEGKISVRTFSRKKGQKRYENYYLTKPVAKRNERIEVK